MILGECDCDYLFWSLDQLNEYTGGVLSYLGDPNSHPSGAPLLPQFGTDLHLVAELLPRVVTLGYLGVAAVLIGCGLFFWGLFLKSREVDLWD
jgi:hypothetical protein